MITPELKLLAAFLTAWFCALFVIPKLASIAEKIGLVDSPDSRKLHDLPRPLVGGIGIVIAATFSSMLFVDLAGFRGLFLGLALLLFIGFLDDFLELPAYQRFLAQIGAAVFMMYFSGVFLVSFGNLLGFGDILVPDVTAAVWCVTIFCVVGVINAINMIDGMDGLAGGISFIALLTFALHALLAGQIVLVLINLAFAGGVLGFLRYNWNPATVFLGDAGSLTLGFVLAFMSVAMTQGENQIIPPVVPLLVLAVPITDTVVLMSKRMLRGRSPFAADRYHLHHIFMRYGLNKKGGLIAILSICLFFSTASLLIHVVDIPQYLLFGVYALFFAGYFAASFFIVSTMRTSLRLKRRIIGNGSEESNGKSN